VKSNLHLNSFFLVELCSTVGLGVWDWDRNLGVASTTNVVRLSNKLLALALAQASIRLFIFIVDVGATI
jgi:hypothetical protein